MRKMHPQIAGTYKLCALIAVCCSFISASHAEPTAAETDIAAFTFRDGEIHNRKVTRNDGLLIAEHDMIMGVVPGNSAARQIQGLSNSTYGRTWPNGVVPYQLSSSLNADTIRRVEEAVEHWNSFESITLVERTSSNASAYPDYINFVYDERCASWIGFQATGPQAIYTGDKCSTGTIIHEIGHALGLLHEHTRPDRDQYVKIHLDRVTPGMEINFEVLEGSVLLGEYDYGSIMHYGEYFFMNPYLPARLPTIEPVRETDAQIGQRIETSPGDREAIANLYATDLTLVASADEEASAGDIELNLQVTNNTDTGANTLSIEVPLTDEINLRSFSSASWSCFQQVNTVSCETPVLAAGATASVSLNLFGNSSNDVLVFNAALNSRTKDTNTTDNRDHATTRLVQSAVQNPGNSEVLAVAPINEDAEPKIGSALDGGGGTADLRWLMALALLGSLAGRRPCLFKQITQVASPV